MKTSQILSVLLLFLLPLFGASGVNMPNYDSAQYLVFGRSQGQPQHQPLVNSLAVAPVQAPANSQADVKPGSEEVRDAINGYSFTVPGIISVSAHQAKSMQELQGLMSQGLQEEGIYLNYETLETWWVEQII